MVYAIINISDYANRILKIIKAKYDLRDKSQAIDMMAEQYGGGMLEPELRPEYVEKMRRVQKEKPIYIGTVKKLRARYE